MCQKSKCHHANDGDEPYICQKAYNDLQNVLKSIQNLCLGARAPYGKIAS